MKIFILKAFTLKVITAVLGKNAANLFFENVKINGNTDYMIDSPLTKAVIKK